MTDFYFVLVLVLVHPSGNSGVSSQMINGYRTQESCMEAANKLKAARSVAAAICVGKDGQR